MEGSPGEHAPPIQTTGETAKTLETGNLKDQERHFRNQMPLDLPRAKETGIGTCSSRLRTRIVPTPLLGGGSVFIAAGGIVDRSMPFQPVRSKIIIGISRVVRVSYSVCCGCSRLMYSYQSFRSAPCS